MPFDNDQRNILGQALTSFAAGFLFLKSFSDNLRFLIAGIILVAVSFFFIVAALGLVIKILNRIRNFSLKYGSNLWFAFTIISLARVIVSWGGAPRTQIPQWLNTSLFWLAPIWLLVFSAVFIILAVCQTIDQVRREGRKKGVGTLLVSLSWVLGVFSVSLLLMTDVDIRYSLAMIGVAVVALATRFLIPKDT